MGLFSKLFRIKKEPKKIKIGLALGSGGAKGFAELGAKKAFEENGVEFDMFAGTSIGSILGAFFADGYTSTDVFELLRGVDFNEIKTLFMIKMDTSGLFDVIDRYIGSLTFEELKKPFRAVATELETGSEKVFDKGSVAKALCASSAMPPFFKPVVIDDKRYVDGAFANSVPADVLRGLGADYVIGIDLKNHEEKSGIISKIIPTFKGVVDEPWRKGYENSDVMLHPDLTVFRATSFFDGNEMYEIGYRTAIEYMPKIKAEISALTGEKNKGKKCKGTKGKV